MADTPYNPLDKRHLGESVAEALLQQPPAPLDELAPFDGAGIYAIYYTGSFPSYREIARRNSKGRFAMPIYVGKAIPAGARKGDFGLGTDPGQALHGRLREHANSIRETSSTLSLSDFHVRYLVVEDIWIPLGENLLIAKYRPAWNLLLDGFGNHDPGKGRYNQQRSHWDTIHPGRAWAMKCASNAKTPSEISSRFEENLRDALDRESGL
jgi:hypothetical protein